MSLSVMRPSAANTLTGAVIFGPSLCKASWDESKCVCLLVARNRFLLGTENGGGGGHVVQFQP